MNPLLAIALFLNLLTLPVPGKPAKAWSDKMGLSFVSTSGNAAASTLGFMDEFTCRWSGAQLQASVSAVRIKSTTVLRTATGSSLADYQVQESRVTAATSESYVAGLRYDHKLTERFFWFGAAGWERNVPTGLEGRAKVNAGLGRTWISRPFLSFRTDLGLGYVNERPVFEPQDFKASFATWNVNAKAERKFGRSAGFISDLAFSNSLKDNHGYLAVWKNALTSNLNAHFALKVGLDLNYRNRPASIGVDLYQPGEPPVLLGQVPFELKKLDSVFTSSLVWTF